METKNFARCWLFALFLALSAGRGALAQAPAEMWLEDGGSSIDSRNERYVTVNVYGAWSNSIAKPSIAVAINFDPTVWVTTDFKITPDPFWMFPFVTTSPLTYTVGGITYTAAQFGLALGDPAPLPRSRRQRLGSVTFHAKSKTSSSDFYLSSAYVVAPAADASYLRYSGSSTTQFHTENDPQFRVKPAKISVPSLAIDAPILYSVSPTAASAGDANITLTVVGSDSATTILWNNDPIPTMKSAGSGATATFIAALNAAQLAALQTNIVRLAYPYNGPSGSIGYTPSNAFAFPVQTSRVGGKVTLEGCAGAAQPITFTLTGASATQTVAQTPAADGSFGFDGLTPDVYTVTAQGSKWLRAGTTADATLGGATNLAFALRGGDANHDNRVDVLDFGILVNAYGSLQSDPNSGYDATADFNCDGSVDVLDFGLLVNNYGTSGI